MGGRSARSLVGAVVLAFLLSACGGGTEHWDGIPYVGRPVFGSGAEQGISQRLHDDAQECGLDDDVIEQAMQGVVAGSTVDIQNIYAQGGSAQVTLTELGDGIWELQLRCA